MWEDPIVAEVHRARENLAAECGYDIRAFFAGLRKRQSQSKVHGKPTVTEHWSVWRIDDNGNKFVVREKLCHAEAERLVAEFTARGHKQMYWSEPEETRAEPGAAAIGGA